MAKLKTSAFGDDVLTLTLLDVLKLLVGKKLKVSALKIRRLGHFDTVKRPVKLVVTKS